MADTPAQVLAPGERGARRPHPVLWLGVLLVTVALLGVAVWSVGGPLQAMSVLGLDWATAPFGGGSGGSQPKPAASADASATKPAATTLPSQAQEQMFTEQVQSRETLEELIGGGVHSFALGDASVQGDAAKVPIKAVYSSGTEVNGTITFSKFDDVWYFFSIGRSGSESKRSASGSHSFDSGVAATMAQAQAQAETQKLITDGIFGGGFKNITIDSVQTGPRTATLDLTLSGGTSATSRGRLVFISKTEADKTYWFLTSFEKR